jgi:hypothetical protein
MPVVAERLPELSKIKLATSVIVATGVLICNAGFTRVLIMSISNAVLAEVIDGVLVLKCNNGSFAGAEGEGTAGWGTG